MSRHLGAVTLLVRDYNEAIVWYTQKLGFTLVSDTPLGEGKRWVMVAPSGDAQTRILMARAASPEQIAQIGHQAGGRVFLLLNTDNFHRDHEAYVAAGVRFCETPREESYGMVAVFEDLYGNKWDLLELR